MGVDVERADAPRYFRTAALIQVGTADHVVLVDAVALDPVPLLSDFLAERTAILHALPNDLDPLRAVGVEVGPVHDTAVAASLLGLPVGLDPLLQELLDVALSPDKERFQRADWERRPLPDGHGRLRRRGRRPPRRAVGGPRPTPGRGGASPLVRRRSSRRPSPPPTTRNATGPAPRAQDGCRPAQRSVLHAIWDEREAICREFDLAPNRLLRDPVLLDLAQNPAEDAPALVRRNQRRGRPSREHAERLFAAQQDGLDAPPEPRPSGGSPWTPAHRDAYDAMRRARAAKAEEIGLDAGVLCPSKALWGPVRGEPTTPQELCDLAGLRPWQCEVLAEDLWEAYTTALAAGEAGRGPRTGLTDQVSCSLRASTLGIANSTSSSTTVTVSTVSCRARGTTR